MSDAMEEVLRLDRAGQHQEIIDSLLRRSNDPLLILYAITHLLRNYRFTAASYLGNALARVGIDHPVARLASAFGAIVANDIAKESDIIAALARHYDAMAPEQQAFLYREVLNPPLLRLIAAAHAGDNIGGLLRLLEVLKACSPALRHVFDWYADPASPGATGARDKLIAYREPPPGTPRVPYRVIVAIRERIFPQMPDSRLLDIGPRFVSAATAYGWATRFCPLTLGDLARDFTAIIDQCRAFAADIVIIDDHCIQSETTHEYRRTMLAALRLALPSIKIVAVYFDSWQIPPDHLRRAASDLDAIWATTPAMAHWRDPVFSGKLLQAPLAHAGHMRAPDSAAPDRISFVGGLTGYNPHRIFWRAAAIAHALPIDWHVTTHKTDGLAPLESYADYLRRLAARGCALNLAMRDDLTRVITDRAFEALLTGTLLIQEAAGDLDYFLVAGRHYLRIEGFADLRAAIDLVKRQPERASEIRQAGHEFAVARYADDKLFGYLDALLFHSAP